MGVGNYSKVPCLRRPPHTIFASESTRPCFGFGLDAAQKKPDRGGLCVSSSRFEGHWVETSMDASPSCSVAIDPEHLTFGARHFFTAASKMQRRPTSAQAAISLKANDIKRAKPPKPTRPRCLPSIVPALPSGTRVREGALLLRHCQCQCHRQSH